MRNDELLNSWIKAGYASIDMGDGAWGWTQAGEKISLQVRTILSDMLYGTPPDRWMISLLFKEFFDENGFPLQDD